MTAKELRSLIEDRIIPKLEEIAEYADCPRSQNEIAWLIDNTKGAMD